MFSTNHTVVHFNKTFPSASSVSLGFSTIRTRLVSKNKAREIDIGAG